MHAFIGGMGFGEMLLVFFIAAFLFGKRLPEIRDSNSRSRMFQRHEQYEAEELAWQMAQAGRKFLLVAAIVAVVAFVAYVLWNLGIL
jgi:hypothetical protein